MASTASTAHLCLLCEHPEKVHGGGTCQQCLYWRHAFAPRVVLK